MAAGGRRTMPPAEVRGLQRAAGNRAFLRLRSSAEAVQRLQSISDVVPPHVRVPPRTALRAYVAYLLRECGKYEGTRWSIVPTLQSIDARLAGSDQALKSDEIMQLRREMAGPAAELRELEAQSRQTTVDSDVTREYQPLKACVIQSLEQMGSIGSAREYHDELWSRSDNFRYYDTDEVIGPLYSSHGLKVTDAGESYASLVQSLPDGRYIMNVDSPAGPNGHMFFVEIQSKSKNGKLIKVPVPRQDKDNLQSWQPSDKIIRYWQ